MRIVRSLGGDLRAADDAEGGGARFCLDLPALPAPRTATPDPEQT